MTLGALTSGCPDPGQAFDDFVERRPALEPSGDCPDAYLSPAPGDIDGDYFMTLLTSVNTSKPLFVLAKVTTEAQGDGLGLAMNLQFLDKNDRTTPVGTALDAAAVPVGTDGSFELDLPDLQIPAAANALAPVDATGSLHYTGNICGDGSFICGDLSGTANALGNTYDLTGSTFTIQRITDPAAYPEPLLDCKGTKLTPP